MAQFYPRHYLSSLYSIGIAVSFQTYYKIWLYLKGLGLDHHPFYTLVGILPTVGYKVWPPSFSGYFNGIAVLT